MKNEKNVRRMVEVIHNTMMRNEHERRSISIEKQSYLPMNMNVPEIFLLVEI